MPDWKDRIYFDDLPTAPPGLGNLESDEYQVHFSARMSITWNNEAASTENTNNEYWGFRSNWLSVGPPDYYSWKEMSWQGPLPSMAYANNLRGIW